MRKTFSIVAIGCILTFLSWTILQTASYPAHDPDEGIYLNTFVLMSKGFAVYRTTFMSQLPAFVIAVYPLFLLLGRTLAAARIAMGIWSLVCLAAVIWVTVEIGRKWLSLLAVSLLLLTVYFARQIFIIQSDMLAPVFSLLALASFLRYTKHGRIRWFIISSFFINAAVYTKLDVTIVPGLLLGLWHYRRNRLAEHAGIFLLVSVLSAALFILPFGAHNIWDNVMLLRLQTARTTPFSWHVNLYLLYDPVLFVAVLCGFALPFVRKKSLRPPLGILAVWLYTTYIFFIFYRPLYYHHMTLLTVPAVLLFACILQQLLSVLPRKIFMAVLGMLTILVCYRLFAMVNSRPSYMVTENENKAVRCITDNTTPQDWVISDEAMLVAASGRLPPPPLSDISYVRITSGNLSSDKFSRILKSYRPKMVVVWNGRLLAFKDFARLLNDYTEISCAGENKAQHIYVRK